MDASELAEYQGNLNAAEAFFTGLPKTKVDCQYLLKHAGIERFYGDKHRITVEQVPAGSGIKCRVDVPEITGAVGRNMLDSDLTRVVIPGVMLKDLKKTTDLAIGKVSLFGDRPDMTVTVTMPDSISKATAGGKEIPFDGNTVTVPFDKATGGVEVETGLAFWVNVVMVVLLVLAVLVPVGVIVLVVVLVCKARRKKKAQGLPVSQGGENTQP